MRSEFSQQHSAGIAQAARHLTVLRRYPSRMEVGPTGGKDTGGVVDIFEGNRNAVQGPAVHPVGDLLFGAFRVSERALMTHRHIGEQGLVQCVDALEERASQLNRGQRSRPDAWRGLRNR